MSLSFVILSGALIRDDRAKILRLASLAQDDSVFSGGGRFVNRPYGESDSPPILPPAKSSPLVNEGGKKVTDGGGMPPPYGEF